ncbi:MAG: helix-turn-helix domain-containing protein, partial [Flavobacterium sp.]|nr:helix-turn-helix domain-containing protein [Flavobacterium sp.]
MKEILKQARIDKELSTRKLAEIAKIDQALISKFENGFRIPTKK